MPSHPLRTGDTCQDCHMGLIPGQPSGRDKGPIAVVDGYVYPDRDLISSVYW